MTCNRCGYILRENDKNCPRCGTTVYEKTDYYDRNFEHLRDNNIRMQQMHQMQQQQQAMTESDNSTKIVLGTVIGVLMLVFVIVLFAVFSCKDNKIVSYVNEFTANNKFVLQVSRDSSLQIQPLSSSSDNINFSDGQVYSLKKGEGVEVSLDSGTYCFKIQDDTNQILNYKATISSGDTNKFIKINGKNVEKKTSDKTTKVATTAQPTTQPNLDKEPNEDTYYIVNWWDRVQGHHNRKPKPTEPKTTKREEPSEEETKKDNNKDVTEEPISEPVSEKSDFVTGSCGGGVTWTFYIPTGKLEISGTGNMTKSSSSMFSSNEFDLNDIKKVEVKYGVTSISSSTFENMVNLEVITIASSVKTIGKYAFSNCQKLRSISLEYGLLEIDSYAFEGCNSIDYIKIPSSVYYIASSVFYGWSDMQTVDISNCTEINMESWSSSWNRGCDAYIVE